MVIDVAKAKAVTFRLRNFTLTVEPIEWKNGKTAVHLYFEVETRLFAGICADGHELAPNDHLILTGPNP